MSVTLMQRYLDKLKKSMQLAQENLLDGETRVLPAVSTFELLFLLNSAANDE